MRQWQGQTGLNLDIDIRRCHCRIKLQIVALTLQKANSWLAKPKLRKPGFISLSAVNSMETWSSLSQGKTVTLLDAINSCLFTPMCQHPHLRCFECDAAKFQFPHPLERNPAKLKKRHGTKPSPVPWLSISKKCVSQKPSWTVWISNLQLGPKPRSWTWSWIWPIGLSTHLRHPEKEQDATTTSLGFLCSWQSQVNEGKSSFSAKQPTISNRHPKTIARFRQVLDEVWKTLAPLRDSSQSWSSQQPCTWQSSILIYINWQITETHAKHLNLNQSINSLIHPSFSIQGPLDNRFVMIKCPLSLDAQVTRCPGSLKQSTTWHVASPQASTNSAPRRASFPRTPSAVVHTKVGLQRADAFDKCKTKQTVTWPRFQRRKLATCKFTFQLAAFFRLGWSD